MLIIVTAPDDVHADAAETDLRRRGARYVRFDPAALSTSATVRVEHDSHRSRYWLHTADDVIPLHDISAGWIRRPGRPVSSPLREGWLSEHASRETENLVHDLWNHLTARWLPGPLASIRRADFKNLQLGLARSVGLAIPATLVSNDPDALLDFYRRHDGRIIDKMPSVLMASQHGRDMIRFTQPVSLRDLAQLQRLRTSPMMFQANVAKRSELRVTVVGDRVFAAEIESQQTERTRTDWRRYNLDQTPHRACQLPVATHDACVALVRALGLVYGAIDLVLTPDGEYVFLEINPNGQYLWIEHLTGLPITSAIVDYLVGAEDSHG